jgi:biotin-(acetyl-CoA carboxylase) ligase
LLDLPPLFLESMLREGGDAFARAVALAEAGAGAGNLVWVRRYDSADCAVILEPEEPLAVARQVIFAGQVALAAALLAVSPPEKPLSLRWPDAVIFDGGLVGGARITTAPCAEDETPEWLVFGFTLRLVAHVPDGAIRPSALIDEGFDDLETGKLVESFARHLMQVIDEWSNTGIEAVLARWTALSGAPPMGDLAAALVRPSWLVDGEIAP